MTNEEPIQYASESSRFYDKDGNAQSFVPNKSKPGELRRATLRDAKANHWYPSVTTILSVIAKPGLDTWKVDQYLKVAYEVCTNDAETEEEWSTYIKSEATRRMDICRDLGVDVHGAINRHWKGDDSDPRFDPFLEASVNALKDIGVWDKQVSQDLESERTFACTRFGFGGCLDGSLSNEPVVWDFKAIDNLSKKWDWPERLAQISAYLIGRHAGALVTPELFLEHSKGYNIAISTNEPGKYAIRAWSSDELVRGWNIFRSANNLYRALNQYEP